MSILSGPSSDGNLAAGDAAQIISTVAAIRRAPAATPLTWRQIVARVPQLGAIIAEARRLRASRTRETNEWADYSRLKMQVCSLVGWDAYHAPADLRTHEVYNVVHRRLVDALGV